MPAYYLACSRRDVVVQAMEGEKAYFDGICCDGPEQLAAVGEATDFVRLGSIPPAGPRDPAVVARTLATLTPRFPGRPFLGVASDELELVVGLLAEESLRTPVYVSASDDAAAHLAGRLGDGLWTSADPERAPALIEAFHEGRAEAGKDDGEILLQASFAWEPAFVGAPARSAVLEQQTAADAQSVVVSARPDEHVERIREIERLGATAVVLTNVSGSPLEAVRAYGRDVLPKLRG